MFKILVVEDDQAKLRDIMLALASVEGIDIDSVETEIDAHSAKVRMRTKHYDLLILDISIPMKREKEVEPNGGLKLLEEIIKRDIFLTPIHIIGLTAYEDVFNLSKTEFDDNLLTIIHYSLTSDDWKNRFLAGVNQHMNAKSASTKVTPEYNYDVAIVCALSSELDANMNNGWKWSVLTLTNDDTTYHTTTITNADGTVTRVVAAAAARMGMPASAAITMKMILEFRPKFLFMTGIMAGVSDKVKLGDIIVANPIWDWGSGKWITSVEENQEKSLFLTDTFQFTVDRQLVNVVEQFAADGDALYKIRKSYSGISKKEDFSIHIGPVASGASVLSDKAVFRRVNDQHRKLLGVEMEAYGVFTAVESASRPKPLSICIKAVVDYGDKEKSDDYQHYGCYLSAGVAKSLIGLLDYNR